MTPRYLFGLDANGAIVIGTVIDDPSAVIPIEYSVEGTLQQWQAQERSFHDAIAGAWTTYPLLTVAASPNPAVANQTLTVTATLPAGSPDSQVAFRVVGGASYVETCIDGQATHAFAFAAAGTYRIAVSSTHHGVIEVEVMVQ